MTTEEVRAHAAAWMAKQDPTKNLPMREACDDALQDMIALAEDWTHPGNKELRAVKS